MVHPPGPANRSRQVLYAPGSKSLLFALLAAIGGDVVLPRPAWVSYAAQAALLGRRVLWVPVPAEAGGIPDPGRLARALRLAGSEGVKPRVMVLTVPDNRCHPMSKRESARSSGSLALR